MRQQCADMLDNNECCRLDQSSQGHCTLVEEIHPHRAEYEDVHIGHERDAGIPLSGFHARNATDSITKMLD
jgi:hypothetical protein